MSDTPYPNVPESDFGIPSERKYPCDTPEHCRAALSYWGMPKNRAQYSTAEQARIYARIRRLAKKHGVEPSEDTLHDGALNEAVACLYAETLIKARAMEFDSISTYTELLSLATSDADRAVLQEILDDEKDHERKLSLILFDAVTR